MRPVSGVVCMGRCTRRIGAICSFHVRHDSSIMHCFVRPSELNTSTIQMYDNCRCVLPQGEVGGGGGGVSLQNADHKLKPVIHVACRQLQVLSNNRRTTARSPSVVCHFILCKFRQLWWIVTDFLSTVLHQTTCDPTSRLQPHIQPVLCTRQQY